MSIERSSAPSCDVSKQISPVVQCLIQPHEKDLGGFQVRRSLPYQQKQTVGPWVFFDHIGPAVFPPGQGIDVRPHPHINLATVTYLFEGQLLHRDSLGNTQTIQPGAVNLMIAGRGIVHSEREDPAVHQQPHHIHGLQLWLALPVELEEMEPAFYHYPVSEIPHTVVEDVSIRVIIGNAYGIISPVKTLSETLYVEASLSPNQNITLPKVEECAVYIIEGQLQIQDTDIGTHHMAIFHQNKHITLKATENSRIVIIGGKSLGPRFIEWNFVSSRQSRIEEAKQQWRELKFPSIPDDNQEFIPLPE